MQNPDPIKLGNYLTARSAGVMAHADPSEGVNLDTLLFNCWVRAPAERIRYIGTSWEIFGDGVEFPVSRRHMVPGSVPVNRFGSIDVLANDLRGSTWQ